MESMDEAYGHLSECNRLVTFRPGRVPSGERWVQDRVQPAALKQAAPSAAETSRVALFAPYGRAPLGPGGPLHVLSVVLLPIESECVSATF